MSTLKRVCDDTPEPITHLNPDIPAWLSRIIERLHAKDPENRYDSAAEVASLLGRCLAHLQQPATVPLPAELNPAPLRRAVPVWALVPACLLLAAVLSFPTVRAAAQQAAEYVVTVLRLKTPEGVLVIETDDPSVAIKVDDNDVVISGAGIKELRLSAGSHRVETLKEGKPVREELVTITRGGRKVVSVRREWEVEKAEAAPKTENHAPDRHGLTELKAKRPTASLSSASTQPGRLLSPRQGTSVASALPRYTLVGQGAEVVPSRTHRTASSWHRVPRAARSESGTTGKQDGSSSPHISQGLNHWPFHPTGETLASGGRDHQVKLWNLDWNSKEAKLLWNFAGFSDGVRSLAFSAPTETFWPSEDSIGS